MSDGLLILDKPSGITSNRLVSQARRLVGVRKIGHAGTLDPMATGLMILGVGKATRLLGHLMLADKTYTAKIRLGLATTTDDAEGEVTTQAGCSLSLAQVEPHLEQFRGQIQQIPSSVSAIKVAGKRAYDLVRAGEKVELKAREVTVSRFEILDHRRELVEGTPVLDLEVIVDCSTGTYIRALARDLGGALGVGGHLTALRRTRVGPFSLAEVSEELLDLFTVAQRCFPCFEVDAEQARDVAFGRPLSLPLDSPIVAITHVSQLLALYRGDGKPVAVLV